MLGRKEANRSLPSYNKISSLFFFFSSQTSIVLSPANLQMLDNQGKDFWILVSLASL